MFTNLVSHVYSLLFLFAGVAAFPQANLVPNPSFETNTTCPTFFGQLVVTGNWYTPTYGTPDYFNGCNSGGFCEVPSNVMGYQAVRTTGFGYGGLITYFDDGTGNLLYREYMQTQLSMSLTAGQRYFLSMYISLGDSSGFSADGMGVHLSTTAINLPGITPTGDANFTVTPQISNSQGIITNSTGWTKIVGTFVATGGEAYMTIGNFNNNANTNFQARANYGQQTKEYAYYYIDDVCLSSSALTCSVTNVGINDHDLIPFAFFYNSTTDKIVLEKGAGDYTIKIMDLFGAPVKLYKQTEIKEIDVSELPPGCYFISVSTTNASVVKKVIIE